ncbi:hypothetical protein CARUB_v10025391mg [Capsella rubella]|uniref:AB hydrolase-1 domain-containing protein n=1 Tax=Capsella rubella TaxID=81985 RepID=R0HHI0_9BRAS|nr:hypothetical protein CARUB_v10025391mg [Capsella rubella]
MESSNQKQFVLVHGVCHGAWTWYKVKAQLEVASNCVTAVDVEEIQTLQDYCKPIICQCSPHLYMLFS